MKTRHILPGTLLALCSLLAGVAHAQAIDYREAMRQFVIDISGYAKNAHPGFIIIPQNGLPLITSDGEPGSPVVTPYADAIDGTGIESLFYGYSHSNAKTPAKAQQPMLALAHVFSDNHKTVMVTDYCSTRKKTDRSYASNNSNGFLSFTSKVSLTVIPRYPEQPYNVNNHDINQISDASNFLYLINPAKFNSKEAMINAISNTDYDMMVIDLFFNDEALTPADLTRLKTKKNGGKRLVISYMSIGEAESYRYYWNPDWKKHKPEWLERLNKRWPGNYKVQYWNPEWQAIIYGSENAYLDKILQAGFDGSYLDIIDGYEYFESRAGL